MQHYSTYIAIRRLLRGVLLFAAFIPYALASGQEISFTVNYPRVVAVGETFQVVYTVNRSGGDFSAPSFDNFYRISGPHISYSQSTRIVDGRRSSEISYSYTYRLQAMEEGKYTIAAATFERNDKVYRSEELSIEVVPDQEGRTDIRGEEGRRDATGARDGDIFIRVEPQKSRVWVGEPFVVEVNIYSRIDISGISEIQYPSFTGFMREDLETPALRSLERVNIDGTIYGRGTLQRFMLYPQMSGEIEIEPVRLTVQVRERAPVSDPFFGDIFRSFSSVPRAVKGEGVTITVLPLPGGSPDRFRGSVGDFTIEARADRDTLSVNEAVTLRVRLSGRGNLRMAEAPDIAFPETIEAYDPQVNIDRAEAATGLTRGVKSFEYLLIPRQSGDFQIPAINYHFFEPESGTYRTVTQAPINIHVRRGTGDEERPSHSDFTRAEDMRYLGRDIRYIRTSTGSLSVQRDLLVSKRGFYSLYGVAALAFIIVVVVRREKIKRDSDRVRLINRKAGGVARSRLKSAFNALQNDETDRFYEEILKALWGYIGDKFNIPVSELTGEKINSVLVSANVEVDLTDRLRRVVDRCEMARYASVEPVAEAKSLYSETAEIIRDLEKRLN